MRDCPAPFFQLRRTVFIEWDDQKNGHFINFLV
jgi:hypothetical protein